MNATDQSNPTVDIREAVVREAVVREAWADLIALELPAAPTVVVRPAYGRRFQQAALLLAPIAIAWITLRLLPPVYVSDTSFILRHQAEPLTLPSSGTDLSGTPSETGSADSYAVRDYLLSRDAMNAAGANYAGKTNEARYQNFSKRVAVNYETSSGVITIRAEARDAQQAHDLAAGLRDAASALITKFNHAAGASEYLAPLSEPDLPDSPTRQNQPLVLLGAAALGLALAWSRRG
jgi:capsular polysaccharide biosynthesis protein